MSQKAEVQQNSEKETNSIHASFLIPFFTEMNDRFAGKWCVLHSYETLPYYSESDVDMAFSGLSFRNLEALMIETALRTGWQFYQKLWYDVQWCCYYVLREKKTGTLLAIDFLKDDHGIGSYGFKTTVLTQNCKIIDNLIPVPNHETALSYKLVKRIEKVRLFDEDGKYLKSHFISSDEKKVALFLDRQYGMEGKNSILSYLKEERGALTKAEMVLLKRKRKEHILSLKTRTQFVYWEMQRVCYRIKYPSGMLVNVPKLEKKTMQDFTEMLKQKVGILFRFVRPNLNNSKIEKFKGIIGSTLCVCPRTNFDSKKTVRYHFLYPKYVAFDSGEKLDFDDLDSVTDKYLKLILEALSICITSKLSTDG